MTHIVYTSIARRLDDGTYSPAIIARMPAPAPVRHVASLPARVATIAAPYVGSVLLGALLALAFQVRP